MIPASFPQANTNFGPPPGLTETQVATVHGWAGRIGSGSMDGAQAVVIAWMPTLLDLERLGSGQPVFVSFVGGIPPHFLTTTFEEAVNPA